MVLVRELPTLIVSARQFSVFKVLFFWRHQGVSDHPGIAESTETRMASAFGLAGKSRWNLCAKTQPIGADQRCKLMGSNDWGTDLLASRFLDS